MRTAGLHFLHLVLAALGLLLAATAARTTAGHGAAFWVQVVLGTLAYAAATGAVGRALGIHPADAIEDSITALITTTAAAITLAAAVLTLVSRFIADHATSPAPAPAAGPAPLSKTA